MSATPAGVLLLSACVVGNPISGPADPDRSRPLDFALDPNTPFPAFDLGSGEDMAFSDLAVPPSCSGVQCRANEHCEVGASGAACVCDAGFAIVNNNCVQQFPPGYCPGGSYLQLVGTNTFGVQDFDIPPGTVQKYCAPLPRAVRWTRFQVYDQCLDAALSIRTIPPIGATDNTGAALPVIDTFVVEVIGGAPGRLALERAATTSFGILETEAIVRSAKAFCL
jgi:hypothetical protein